MSIFLYILYISPTSSVSIPRVHCLRRLFSHGDALQGGVVLLRALSIFGRSPLLFDAATIRAWRWQCLVVLELGGDVHVVAIREFFQHVFHGELARVGAIGLVCFVGKSNRCDGIREIIIIIILFLIGSECLVVFLEDRLYRFAAFFACTAG